MKCILFCQYIVVNSNFEIGFVTVQMMPGSSSVIKTIPKYQNNENRSQSTMIIHFFVVLFIKKM